MSHHPIPTLSASQSRASDPGGSACEGERPALERSSTDWTLAPLSDLIEYIVAKAEYDSATAQSRETEARVGEIRAAIERKTIRAPFSGILGIRQVNKGQAKVHHDALEFPDGKTVLLTQLCKGQRATVLQLPAGIGVTVDDAQSKDSTVASPVAPTLVAGAD